MYKLAICICCGLFSVAAVAETSVNQWLAGLDYRGVQIEHIRVMSEKPLQVVEETDAEVESILEETQEIEKAVSESEKSETSID